MTSKSSPTRSNLSICQWGRDDDPWERACRQKLAAQQEVIRQDHVAWLAWRRYRRQFDDVLDNLSDNNDDQLFVSTQPEPVESPEVLSPESDSSSWSSVPLSDSDNSSLDQCSDEDYSDNSFITCMNWRSSHEHDG